MALTVPLVLDVVDRTMQQATMRLTLATRRGRPVAEPQDERATGIAAPQEQVSLVAERPLSQRMLEELLEEVAWKMADRSADERAEEEALHREVAKARVFLYERGSWMLVKPGDVWSSRKRNVGDPRAPRDPLWILDALRGAKTCESVGSDVVRGAQTQRYRVQVNLAAAERRVPSGLLDGCTKRTRRQREVRKWRASMLTEIWVDQERRLRRATWLTIPQRSFLARTVERRDPLWTTLELWDFGVPAPPPGGQPGKPADDALKYLSLRLPSTFGELENRPGGGTVPPAPCNGGDDSGSPRR
jgi:hypothetical protein